MTATLPPERPGRAPSEELVARRAMMPMARVGSAEELRLGGVRALRFAASGKARGTLLHLHGGGFRLGSPEGVSGFAAALAAGAGVDVVCPAYRLAPEHPFPAALTDARRVLMSLRGPLILSGDSAGGGLAAGLAMLAHAEGVRPAGLILHSPWLDLTVSAPSYAANAASDRLFSAAAAREAAELYLQGVDPRDPLASPLHGPTRGYPPAMVSVGGGEVLADDARRFVRALAGAGVEARLVEIDGMEHVAVTRDAALPGAATVLAATVGFIRQRLAG